MTSSTVFHNNRTQAIRLPKAVAFPDTVKTVEIRVVGNARIITPANTSWEEWFRNGCTATDDFMADRDQPADQERQAL